MRIFLSGATGFVGRHVVAEAHARGHTVLCLIHSEEIEDQLPRSMEERNRIEVVRGDVALDNGLPEEAAAGCDAIIHLADALRPFPKRGVTHSAVNLRGTEAMIALAHRCGVERVLHMSALGADVGASHPFLRSKGQAEESLLASGLDWTVFRPSLVLGPEASRLGGMVLRLAERRLIFHHRSLRCRFQPIGVRDLAHGLLNALEREETTGKIFEVGGVDVLSVGEMIKMARAVLRRRALSLPLPLATVRGAAGMLERFERFPLSRVELSLLEHDAVCADADAFLVECGVAPASVESVITEACRQGRG